MSKLSRKAINFDFDTKALKIYYPNKSWRKAYVDVRNFLKANGFTHRQWSGYVSKEKMESQDIILLVNNLRKSYPWISQCISRFDVTNIGKTFDMLSYLSGNCKAQHNIKFPSQNTQGKSKQKPHSSLSQLKANAKAQIEKRDQNKGQSISQNKVKNYNER